jgi:hypothetical protein
MNSRSEQSNINLRAADSNAVYFFSALLPSLMDPMGLVKYGPALFARLEKVQAHKKDSEAAILGNKDADRTQFLKTVAEEQMLQQALDWIRNCDLEANP